MNTPPCYSVAVVIDEDDNTYHYHVLAESYMVTKENCEITGRYFWLPSTPKDSDIQKIASSDNDILEVTDYDYDNCTFKAITKQAGEAKIKVFLNDENYSSSLDIVVRK